MSPLWLSLTQWLHKTNQFHPRYGAFIFVSDAARGLGALELGLVHAKHDRAVEQMGLDLVEIVLRGGCGVALDLRTVKRSFFYSLCKLVAQYDAGS